MSGRQSGGYSVRWANYQAECLIGPVRTPGVYLPGKITCALEKDTSTHTLCPITAETGSYLNLVEVVGG